MNWLLEGAITLAVAVLILQWVWTNVQPLLPVLVGGIAVYGFFTRLQHR